jgi:hypothetical protein
MIVLKCVAVLVAVVYASIRPWVILVQVLWGCWRIYDEEKG